MLLEGFLLGLNEQVTMRSDTAALFLSVFPNSPSLSPLSLSLAQRVFLPYPALSAL